MMCLASYNYSTKIETSSLTTFVVCITVANPHWNSLYITYFDSVFKGKGGISEWILLSMACQEVQCKKNSYGHDSPEFAAKFQPHLLIAT